MSVLGISLLSFDEHTVVTFKITDIRDLPFIILYAHYAIIKPKDYGAEKRRETKNEYLQTAPNLGLFIEEWGFCI